MRPAGSGCRDAGEANDGFCDSGCRDGGEPGDAVSGRRDADADRSDVGDEACGSAVNVDAVNPAGGVWEKSVNLSFLLMLIKR